MKKLVLSIALFLPSLFCHGIYFPSLMGDLVEVDGVYYLINFLGSDYALIPELPDGVKVIADYEGDIKIKDTISYDGVKYPVTRIWPNAFEGFTKLRSVEIPKTVKSIGSRAFAYCKNLSHVTIPDGITTLEKGTFFGSGIKSVDLPNSMTVIGEMAFSYCDSLVSVQLPDSISVMSSYLFNNCHNLVEVVLPAHLKTIGAYAFDHCECLSSIALPPELSAILSYSFRNCSSLTEIEFPESLKSIGEHAFWRTSLTSVRVPDSVHTIEGEAFTGCPIITAVLGSGLKYMDPGVFGDCNELTDLYCYAETPSRYYPWGSTGSHPESYSLFSPEIKQRVVLHLPASAIDLYKADWLWGAFRQ